ncbi:DUF6712 family protein [Thermophagus sp. OGC60D27]|uniref:DUF6712 family protein n=1 Tax=Thermophagus sp. OGC60D27 TaxID=3458415 RepID=UPI004038344C
MIVTNIDQVREVIPINARVEFSTLRPYLILAEEKFLQPVLGELFYKRLDDLEDPNEKEAVVVKKCIYAVANYAMWHGFDMLNVTFDDSGFLRSDKDSGLYRYQEENLKSRFKNDAFDHLDGLIEYLQNNISDFSEFKESEFYIETSDSFFKTTSEFNKIYNINNSRLVFLQISRFFDRVIDFEIIPTTGQALFNKIKEEIKKDNPDENILKLVPYIKKTLAFLSVAYGLNELGLKLTEKGMFFETEESGSDSNIKTTMASNELKEQIFNRVKNTGNSYKAMLFEYLRSNSEQYPEFTQLNDTIKSNPFRRDNAGKKTFFV